MKIERELVVSASEVDFLTKKINSETADFGGAVPFAFFMRDDDDRIIAGANGFVIYGAIYTDQLWVDNDFRGRGYALDIMGKIHELGMQSGCTMATVQTMNFQNACDFYKKLGYEVDFERNGYIKKSSCMFMKKIL
jgi:ribosomal protein S18 acetylase RimI-like enzyme